jgi:hypothetical protein
LRTAYGTIIFGKIRIPEIKDDLGEGYIHVRIHDPPDRVRIRVCRLIWRLADEVFFMQGVDDVVFHSIYHEVGGTTADGHHKTWRAIHTVDQPLKFFNE